MSIYRRPDCLITAGVGCLLILFAMIPEKAFGAYSRSWLVSNILPGAVTTLFLTLVFFPVIIAIMGLLWRLSQHSQPLGIVMLVVLGFVVLQIAYSTNGIGAIIGGMIFVLLPAFVAGSDTLLKRSKHSLNIRRIAAVTFSGLTFIVCFGSLIYLLMVFYAFGFTMAQLAGHPGPLPTEIAPIYWAGMIGFALIPTLANYIFFWRVTRSVA
jgi:hypothetical protein